MRLEQYQAKVEDYASNRRIYGEFIAMLLMNTPAAIVTYFIYTLVLPTAVGVQGRAQYAD